MTAQEAGEAEPTTADGAGVAVFDSGWADSGDSADAGDSDAVGDADGVGPGDDSPGPVSNSVPER